MIQNLFTKLKDLYQNKSKIKLLDIKSIDDNNFYSPEEIELFLDDLRFISPKILKKIKDYNNYCYLNPLPNLFIHLKLKSSNLKLRDKKLLKNLIEEIELFRKYFNFTKPINIIIVPTNEKKKLPESKNKIIGPHQVNSGANIFWGNDEQVLLIWRLEEIEKVLLHELIHYFKIDKGFKERNYQEAFTETLTVIYYTIYRLIKSNKSITELKKEIEKELEFSNRQLAKLIKYWYPKKFPEITKNKPIPKDIIDKISPETSVLGYYWFKTALLNQLIKKDNLELLLSDNKKKIREEIIKSLKDKDFQKSIKEEYEKILNKKVNNTLKMIKF